jgi:hypothetical protein
MRICCTLSVRRNLHELERVMNHVTLINPFEVPAGEEDQFVER